MTIQRITVTYHTNPNGILEEKQVTYRMEDGSERTYTSKTLQNGSNLGDMTEISVGSIQDLIDAASAQINEENGI